MATRLTWTRVYGEPLAVVLAAVSIAVVVFVNARPPDQNAADFYVFWDSAHWYRQGLDPYLGGLIRPAAGYNLNVPAVVLLFVPFSFLPLEPAFLLWTALNVAVLAFVANAAASVLGIERRALFVSLVLASQATFAALQLGQLTGVVAALVTGAWVADRRNHSLTAGLLAGVAVAMKPFLGLLALYLLWRRSSRMAVGLVLGGVVVFMTGLVFVGVHAHLSWLVVLRSVTWHAHLSNGSILGLVTRAVTTPPPEAWFTPLVARAEWVFPIWAAGAGAAAAAGLRAMGRSRSRDQHWLLVLLASLLLSPLGWVYYAPLLAGPLTAHYLAGNRTIRLLVWLGYTTLCVPYSFLHRPLGPAATLLLGSAYGWGLLAWFAAACWSARDLPTLFSRRASSDMSPSAGGCPSDEVERQS